MKPVRKATKPSMYRYIVAHNPNEVWALLNKEGYKNKPKSKGQLLLMVQDYVKNDRDDAVIKMAELHPDRELITKLAAGKLNMDSDNENCGGPNLSADASSEKGLTDSSFNKLILAGSAIIALSLITVIITKSNS